MTPRTVPLIAMSAAVALIVLPAAVALPTTIIWNATASAPTGLYLVRPTAPLHVGELVVVMPSEPLAGWLDARGHVPRGVPLLKPVAALPDQRICRHGDAVIAFARDHDRIGRALLVWDGCRTVADDEVFLLNTAHPDSLDGRYFGALPAASIIGRAALDLRGALTMRRHHSKPASAAS